MIVERAHSAVLLRATGVTEAVESSAQMGRKQKKH
jgi:hypothetical protein